MNSFELGPNEQMIAVFRKHPIFMWVSGIKYVVLALLPIVLLPYVGDFGSGSYTAALYIAFIIILWISFFIEWTDFILDTWILTNHRLIDVEQLALFSRRVSTLSLDRIQDITIEQSGFINTMFGIGTVFIQTAGETEEFKIRGIKSPAHVKDIIMQEYQSGKQELFQQMNDLT